MYSSLPVYLLFSLISFVSAGYKLDPFDPKYPNYVHIVESPGHRTWIEIDAIGGKSVYAQIAIWKYNSYYVFAKKTDDECLEFYIAHTWEYDCDKKHSLFAEDYYRFRRISFDKFKSAGCVTEDGRKVEPIHFKDTNTNSRYILMGMKKNIGDVNSAKLIGTYDEARNWFAAVDKVGKDGDDMVDRELDDNTLSQFDPKKWEVFCPDLHNYQGKNK